MQPIEPHPAPPRFRMAERLLTFLAVWTGLLYAMVLTLISSLDNPDDRAILWMGSGLMLFWVVIGGAIQWRWRDQIVRQMQRIALDWRVRFVVLCTIMALIEEAVTTTMSNLGPWLGAETDKAMITASTNYLEVVLLNSVIVFVPMYMVWAWLLQRYAFRPAEVMLCYGLSGALAEMLTFAQPITMLGMWVWVYGLMVYLPARTVPTDRPARRVRWWHWIVAVILPIFGAAAAVPFALLLHKVV